MAKHGNKVSITESNGSSKGWLAENATNASKSGDSATDREPNLNSLLIDRRVTSNGVNR